MSGEALALGLLAGSQGKQADAVKIPRQFIRTYTVAASLAAGASITVGITTDQADKFGPFNVANVVNPSGQMVAFLPDGDVNRQLIVPNAVDKTLAGIRFKQALIKNLDGASATSAAVYVTVARDVDNRELLQALAGKIG